MNHMEKATAGEEAQRGSHNRNGKDGFRAGSLGVGEKPIVRGLVLEAIQ